MSRAFSNISGVGLVIEVEILALGKTRKPMHCKQIGLQQPYGRGNFFLQGAALEIKFMVV